MVWGAERDTLTAGGGDPPALRRRAGRRAQRDAPALRRRPHGLRAHPARPRPHVPRHRQPADARHPRARGAPGPALPEAPWGAKQRYVAAGVPAPPRPLPDPPRRRRTGGPWWRPRGRRPALPASSSARTLKGLRRRGNRRSIARRALAGVLPASPSTRSARTRGRSCARWRQAQPTSRSAPRCSGGWASPRASGGGRGPAAVRLAEAEYYERRPERRLRYALGQALRELRGRVPAIGRLREPRPHEELAR